MSLVPSPLGIYRQQPHGRRLLRAPFGRQCEFERVARSMSLKRKLSLLLWLRSSSSGFISAIFAAAPSCCRRPSILACRGVILWHAIIVHHHSSPVGRLEKLST